MIIISVEAVREKTAERWVAKQDVVWDFARRQFDKSFPRSDAICKLSDIEYLIVQSTEKGAPAQYKAVDFLNSILTFFMGVSIIAIKPEHRQSIKDGLIEVDPLAQDQIQAVTNATRGVSSLSADTPNHFLVRLKLDRSYEILISIDSIWNVYKHAVSSYHLRL